MAGGGRAWRRPVTPLNTSRPVGPRPQEASEARGCTQALDAGQTDGRLRECGPGLGSKLGSGMGLGLRLGSEVGLGVVAAAVIRSGRVLRGASGEQGQLDTARGVCLTLGFLRIAFVLPRLQRM